MHFNGLECQDKKNGTQNSVPSVPLIIFIFLNNFCLYRAGPRPHIPFPPDLILYVNLVAKGAPKFFKTLAPRLTVLDIPYFADAYSRTVRPIDLHNF
jgi:hypothetical protein